MTHRDALVGVILEHLQQQVNAFCVQAVPHQGLHVLWLPLRIQVPADSAEDAKQKVKSALSCL